MLLPPALPLLPSAATLHDITLWAGAVLLVLPAALTLFFTIKEPPARDDLRPLLFVGALSLVCAAVAAGLVWIALS